MSLEKYDIGEEITFSHFFAKTNGNGESGLDVKIDVVNLSPFSLALDAQPMPESSQYDGLYFFKWTPVITTRQSFVVLIYSLVSGKKRIVDEFNIIIDDTKSILIDKIDENDGSIAV